MTNLLVPPTTTKHAGKYRALQNVTWSLEGNAPTG